LLPCLLKHLRVRLAGSDEHRGASVVVDGSRGVSPHLVDLARNVLPALYLPELADAARHVTFDCTLSDGSGNYAPNSDTSPDENAIVSDSSVFVFERPLTAFLSPSLLVGLAILIIIIALLAGLLLRGRKKQ